MASIEAPANAHTNTSKIKTSTKIWKFHRSCFFFFYVHSYVDLYHRNWYHQKVPLCVEVFWGHRGGSLLFSDGFSYGYSVMEFSIAQTSPAKREACHLVTRVTKPCLLCNSREEPLLNRPRSTRRVTHAHKNNTTTTSISITRSNDR